MGVWQWGEASFNSHEMVKRPIGCIWAKKRSKRQPTIAISVGRNSPSTKSVQIDQTNMHQSLEYKIIYLLKLVWDWDGSNKKHAGWCWHKWTTRLRVASNDYFSVWSYDMLLSFCLELVLSGIFMGNSSQASISRQQIISGQWIKVYCVYLYIWVVYNCICVHKISKFFSTENMSYSP